MEGVQKNGQTDGRREKDRTERIRKWSGYRDGETDRRKEERTDGGDDGGEQRDGQSNMREKERTDRIRWS